MLGLSSWHKFVQVFFPIVCLYLFDCWKFSYWKGMLISVMFCSMSLSGDFLSLLRFLRHTVKGRKVQTSKIWMIRRYNIIIFFRPILIQFLEKRLIFMVYWWTMKKYSYFISKRGLNSEILNFLKVYRMFVLYPYLNVFFYWIDCVWKHLA